MLTGLPPDFSPHILLKGRLTSLEKALQEASAVEYAPQHEILAVQTSLVDQITGPGNDKLGKLEEAMCEMMEHFELLRRQAS